VVPRTELSSYLVDAKHALSRGANRKKVEKPRAAKARKNPITGRNEKPQIKRIIPKTTRNKPRTRFNPLAA
jgi:hypothetical protein